MFPATTRPFEVSSSYTTTSTTQSESTSDATSSDSTSDATRARNLSSTITSATTNTREDPSTATSSTDRRPLWLDDVPVYTGDLNPGADVLATTVGVAALYAAIPSTVRIMDEDYVPADEEMGARSVVPGRRERVVHGRIVVLRARGGWARSAKVGSRVA